MYCVRCGAERSPHARGDDRPKRESICALESHPTSNWISPYTEYRVEKVQFPEPLINHAKDPRSLGEWDESFHILQLWSLPCAQCPKCRAPEEMDTRDLHYCSPCIPSILPNSEPSPRVRATTEDWVSGFSSRPAEQTQCSWFQLVGTPSNDDRRCRSVYVESLEKRSSRRRRS